MYSTKLSVPVGRGGMSLNCVRVYYLEHCYRPQELWFINYEMLKKLIDINRQLQDVKIKLILKIYYINIENTVIYYNVQKRGSHLNTLTWEIKRNTK